MTRGSIIRFKALVLACCCLSKIWAFLPLSPPFRRFSHLSLSVNVEQVTSFLEIDDDEFLRNCQVDDTLQNLRVQLPALLQVPLSEDETVYANDILLVGPNGEELASCYEELVSLSSTLVAASAAARQAGAFASLVTNATTVNNTVVDCELALNTNLDALKIQWKVDLPLRQQLSGLSELSLNENGKVSVHRLLDVSIDGQTVNAVGETLATLRKAFRSLGDSPLLTSLRGSPLAASLLTDIRNGLIQQAKTAEDSLPLPPLYVTDSLSTAFNESSSNMTLIDNLPYISEPLPGSLRWASFCAKRQSVSKFVTYGLPVLSGVRFSTRDDFNNLFAQSAEFKGLDGTVMATGGERIAEFYRTMASLRKASSGDWEIEKVSTDWDSLSIIVSWVATNPIKVEGKDRFRLSQEQDEPVIETIEQLSLKIGGNRVQDPEWFRAFLTAVESGRSNAGVDMVMELLQQAGRPQKMKTQVSVIPSPPNLKQEAAASVYGAMCALHRDLPTLVESNPKSPPAEEYLSPNVELRGYFDEMLAKGVSSYSQVGNVLTASLQGVLRTGRVTCDAPSIPSIKFTPLGYLQVSLEMKLRLKVGEGDISVPLNIATVSEFKFNSNGKIKEHKLIETRVNGQLTPGDVVSRWVKGTTANELGAISIQSMMDALTWARNFSSGGTNSNRSQ